MPSSAARSRAKADDLDRQIDAAKALYWSLVRRKAEAEGVPVSHVVTAQAQFVDGDGNVFINGRHVGHIHHASNCECSNCRLGWSVWGLEAAGPPFSPPTDYFDDAVRPHTAAERKAGKRERKEGS